MSMLGLRWVKAGRPRLGVDARMVVCKWSQD
jgi:hypothetical protein